MPEDWVDIPGWTPYQANLAGGIRNGRTLRVLSSYTRYDGYCNVKLSSSGVSKSLRVHRLIALTFVPNPLNKPTVNHKNRDREDNKAENLEWATTKEQNSHKGRASAFPLQGKRAVWKCHRETRERLQLYPSVRAAALDVKGAIAAAGSICAVAGGNTRRGGYVQKSAFGYRWQYDRDNDQLEGECWKRVPADFLRGVEGYSVSDQGRIKNHRGRVGKAYGKAGQYVGFSVRTFQIKAHVLIAKVFVPNANRKPYVNHKNGDKTDCRAENLEWVTASENMQHACDTGLQRTSRAVAQIEADENQLVFASTAAAARATGVPQPSIWAAASGRLHHAGGFQWLFL